MDTVETVERRTRRLLEGFHLAEDSNRCGRSMLRPSSNHGTLWLHNDDDDDISMRREGGREGGREGLREGGMQ